MKLKKIFLGKRKHWALSNWLGFKIFQLLIPHKKFRCEGMWQNKRKCFLLCAAANLTATTGDNGSKLVILVIWQTCNTCKLSRRAKAIIFATERNKSYLLQQFCWHILANKSKNKNGQSPLFRSANSANVHQFASFGMASLCKYYTKKAWTWNKSEI